MDDAVTRQFYKWFADYKDRWNKATKLSKATPVGNLGTVDTLLEIFARQAYRDGFKAGKRVKGKGK